MNNLVYNYKFLVREVRSPAAILGLLDFGFRIFQNRTISLTGVRLPDLRGVKGTAAREAERVRQAAMQELLVGVLTPPGRTAGRTVVVAPHDPSLSGRVRASLYVPCKVLCEDVPALTLRRAGFVLLNVGQLLQFVEQEAVPVDEALALCDTLEPYDFPT